MSRATTEEYYFYDLHMEIFINGALPITLIETVAAAFIYRAGDKQIRAELKSYPE